MRLTILETGRPPEALRAKFPGYPPMFQRLLSAAAPDTFTFQTVAVCDGAPCPPLREVEGLLITGSPAGVYDRLDWMEPLMAYLRAAGAAGIPQVGVCFGHQIMAQAFGGHVRKSERGWGVGRHAYTVEVIAPWMKPSLPQFRLNVSHQDQVVEPPPGARVIARNDHAPHAALWWREIPALSFQGHPEFSDAFLTALIEARRGRTLNDETADGALKSLEGPCDADVVGGWMASFLLAEGRDVQS